MSEIWELKYVSTEGFLLICMIYCLGKKSLVTFPDMIDTYSMRMLDGHSTMDVSYRKLFLLSIKYFYLYSVFPSIAQNVFKIKYAKKKQSVHSSKPDMTKSMSTNPQHGYMTGTCTIQCISFTLNIILFFLI
jgi:hypothetical protein